MATVYPNHPVLDAERRLLDPTVRQDATLVEALLDDTFTEIGQSGRLWTRAETIEALALPEMSTDLVGQELDEIDLREVSRDLFLLRYRLTTTAGQSRRSSLWRLTAGSPRLVFHQGTPVGPAQIEVHN